MTIAYHAGGRITGLSGDTKPTNVPDHTIFHETDTGDDYTILSGVWALKHTTLADSIGNNEISAHTTTKITTTNKSLLNSAIVYTDQVNNFGLFAHNFDNGTVGIFNPLRTVKYTFITSAITINRNVTFPLLTANDIFVFQAHSQTLTNKTLGTTTMSDGANIVLNTTTGTKIGTGATQKLGFWNVTPVVQPAHIVDADGTLADITTKFNTLLAQMATMGLQASS